MARTKLHELSDFGQSLWLDYISRSLLETGKLKNLIDAGLRGMTSNPTIFNQSISESQDYDDKIVQLKEAGRTTFEIYDELTIRDVQEAADFFKPVHEATQGLDGYVSLEINPQLANMVKEQVWEGKRLFKKVNRSNVMIKVPSTKSGFPVIEELLGEGIPVNVTLIFSLTQYQDTVRAFFAGLERLAQKKPDLGQVRSVASVFVSRIDTATDKLLEEKITPESDPVVKSLLSKLKGQAAVANSRLIFQEFKTQFEGPRFKSLQQKGAFEQRVLWASTGTKNPQFSDIKYVTELMSRPTVNTVPEKTLNAFLDHGVIQEALNGEARGAENLFDSLAEWGIDIDQICLKLLSDGVAAFEKSFAELLVSIEQKAQKLCAK